MLAIAISYRARAATAATVTRDVIQRYSDAPGVETVMMLVTFPPGAASPPHDHRAVGLNYVLEGVAESRYAGEPTRRFMIGDSFLDRSDAEHELFRNPSVDKPLRFLVIYRAPTGTTFMQPRH